MSSLVCILNHKSRDISHLSSFLINEGIPFRVFTDITDYREHKSTKWLGLTLNYLKILKYETDHDWKIIIHDDVTISKELFKKINYVLEYAPINYISFYNPTNKGYENGNKSGKHILKTYSNWWSQCHAVPKALSKIITAWAKNPENDKYIKTYAEDGLISRLFSKKLIPIYAVMPSLIQHLGYNDSTFNLPAKCGKNLRNSATYDAQFDVTKIDWIKEFNDPFLNLEKKYFDEEL